jgi:mono/diheme cytochrome c family protein
VRKGKIFFSEEKKQKTFTLRPWPGCMVAMFGEQKFFGSFFQQRTFLLLFACSPAMASPSLLSTYTLHCSGCHGTQGAGVPEKGIPNLADAGLYAGTAAGRAYLAQVPGLSQSRLDDETAARMLNYILRRFSAANMPADFRPYTAGEIAVLRAHKASDAARLRQAILAQVAPGQRGGQ